MTFLGRASCRCCASNYSINSEEVRRKYGTKEAKVTSEETKIAKADYIAK